MGEVRNLAPAKLIIVVLKSQSINIMDEIILELENLFGKVECIFEELPFDTFTYYYNNEMGNNINATILSFEEFIHPSELSYIKNKTNDIENTFSNNGKRIVNLDPGYFYMAQFVLATTKPREFRSYIGKGIWTEPVYYYSKKSLHPFETTYPNYKDSRYISVFSEIRKKYIESLKFFRGDAIEKK
jgi:hypothetical protein